MKSDLKCQRTLHKKIFDSLVVVEKGAETNIDGGEDSFYNGIGFFQEHGDLADQRLLSSTYHHQEELTLPSHVGALDDIYLDIVSHPFQDFEDDGDMLSSVKSQSSPHEPDGARSYGFPTTSLEILKTYRSRIDKAQERKIDGLFSTSKLTSSLQLSSTHIIELAAGNFIHSNFLTTSELSSISHPYASSFLGISAENAKDVQLVQDLLYCAEKVGNQQYNCARKLLEECTKASSSRSSAIQRLVCCFTEALCEKIDRETGRFTEKLSLDSIFPKSAIATLQKKLPVTQVSVFASVQTMIDHVPGNRKVHIIDLAVGCGVRLIVLMQALASRSECPIEQFKVTIVANSPYFPIEEVHFHLKSMAESLKLTFSFNVVRLEDILKHQKKLFDLDDEEAVVVHAAYFLQKMIPKPILLQRLIRALESTRPCIMIVTETETDANSPIFVNRFVESLFFYGAYFDCVEDCLKNDPDRIVVESNILSPFIRNVVAAEGEDRNIRAVSINIWKKFFSRLGMVEIGLSKLALSHANLTRERSNCGDSCTLGLNGNSLVIGWKGTPICSISAWRFHGRQQMGKIKT